MTKGIFSRFFINLKCSEVNTSFAMIKSKVVPQLLSEQQKSGQAVRLLVDPFAKAALEENALISPCSGAEIPTGTAREA